MIIIPKNKYSIGDIFSVYWNPDITIKKMNEKTITRKVGRFWRTKYEYQAAVVVISWITSSGKKRNFTCDYKTY